MRILYKCMPWCFLALFACEIIAVVMPKKDGEMHIREFGRLPVLMGGRIQPFDSVGRNSLLQIRSTGDVPLEEVPSWKFWHHPAKLKSTPWLLEVMCDPDKADTRPVFLIHNPDLLDDLKLADSGVAKSALRYYSFNELKPVLTEISVQLREAEKVEEANRTPLQRQVVKLGNAVYLYEKLQGTLRPRESRDFVTELNHLEGIIPTGVEAVANEQAGRPYDKQAYNEILATARMFSDIADDPSAGRAYPLVVPPPHPEASREDWSNVGGAAIESIKERHILPSLSWLAQISTAYKNHEVQAFNDAVSDYSNWLKGNMPAESAKGRREFFFNDTKLFLHAMIMYLFAFVLSVGGLLTFGTFDRLSEALRKSAFYIILLALVIHTSGLIFRMILEGRPPVTNLYSSAIFIGWGVVVLGSILERIYRVGIGNAVAGCAGFITLIIAHNLAIGGDTMEMLRAVLDTNFWLATHVVVVTLGYASTFLAGLLAISYIFLGLFTKILTRKLSPESATGTGLAAGAVNPATGPATAKALSNKAGKMEVGTALTKMVYGIVCFATLFSFVGTVLGGIWADQSWGRFWGWDPKENGALLIVLWNATILHARWGGMVRERGLMNMAVFGNIVTSFSWFGVNMLGIGLHSYGFMDAAFKWLVFFVLTQVAIIILGMLPKHFWKSFRLPAPTQAPAAATPPKKPAAAAGAAS